MAIEATKFGFRIVKTSIMSFISSQTVPTTSESSKTPVRDNLGPLVTTFIPFSRCSDYTIAESTTSSTFLIEEGLAFYFEAYCGETPTSCFPESTATAPPDGGLRTIGTAFFSPGLICPSGWTTAALATAGSKPDAYGLQNGIAVGTLIPEETAAACCPKGFQYAVDLQQGLCILNMVEPTGTFKTCISSSQSIRDVTRTNIGQSTTVTQTYGTRSVSTQFLFYKSVQIIAPAVRLNFRPEDVSKTSTELPYPTGQYDNGYEDSPRISGGAIAGIAISTLAGVAGLIAIAIWLLRRRRASKKQSVDGDGGLGRSELDCPSDTKPELDSQPRSELPGSEISAHPAELDAANVIPSELPRDGGKASTGRAADQSGD